MKTEYQNNIITKLKKIREHNNYSQNDLASAINMTYGQLGNIESFKQPHKYTLEQIYKICKVFNISITDIFLENVDNNKGNIINELIERIIEYEK